MIKFTAKPWMINQSKVITIKKHAIGEERIRVGARYVIIILEDDD